MHRNWQDLIKPKNLEAESLTDTYGKFVAKPLERGFGLTLGNSLRRVLLSSINGAAIVAVKINGVEHEFSTVAGVPSGPWKNTISVSRIEPKAQNSNARISASVTGTTTASRWLAEMSCSNVPP